MLKSELTGQSLCRLGIFHDVLSTDIKINLAGKYYLCELNSGCKIYLSMKSSIKLYRGKLSGDTTIVTILAYHIYVGTIHLRYCAFTCPYLTLWGCHSVWSFISIVINEYRIAVVAEI